MIAFPISLLFYGITREISLRYSSEIFKRIRLLSIYGVGLSIISFILHLIHSDSGRMFEWMAFTVLWIGSLHLWGMPWKEWMKFAIPIIGVIISFISFFIGGMIGGIVSILMGLSAFVFFYLNSNRKLESLPIIAVCIFVISILVDSIFPNAVWRGWEGAAVVFALVARLITYLHAIHHQSITDRLTGLYNRAAFTEYVENFLVTDRRLGLIFIDIDNFKQKNDTEGHAAGDLALIHTADLLKKLVHGIGVAGRLGGEEMVALIIDEDAYVVAESIREGLPEAAGVTASIGVAFRVKGTTAQELIEAADDAMYKAKKLGKNRVIISTSHQ